MLFLKACPKCHGDMTNGAEPGERSCLQCGFISYGSAPLPFVRERTGRPGPLARFR